MTSHNSKYYTNKIWKRDCEGNHKISDLFRKSQKITSELDTDSNNNTNSSLDHDNNEAHDLESTKEAIASTSSSGSTDTVQLFELSKKYSLSFPWLYYNFS